MNNKLVTTESAQALRVSAVSVRSDLLINLVSILVLLVVLIISNMTGMAKM